VLRLHGDGDPRVAAQVLQLALIRERADHDLAVLDAHPGNAQVGRPIRVEGRDSRHGVRRQELARRDVIEPPRQV